MTDAQNRTIDRPDHRSLNTAMESNSGEISGSVQTVLCVVVFCGILMAGLWPFHAPKNNVTWVKGGGGLRFGRYGVVMSSGTFKIPGSQTVKSCSLEIWLAPILRHDNDTLLAFSTLANPMQFSLYRWKTGLVLRRAVRSEQGHLKIRRSYAGGTFHEGQSVFIAITSDGSQTAVYVDGVLVRTSRPFQLPAADFNGELVVGNSPVHSDSWMGVWKGLAIYSQDLTAAQVRSDYETWTQAGRPEVGRGEQCQALYVFDEHEGAIVHNQIRSGVDLYIPERYQVLHQAFLERPWTEFRPNLGYLKNVLINIGGFVPLGFLFCAWCSMAGRTKRASLLAIILGFATSVTIEVLQAYLPTRSSGMTDIITNTLGTCFGVMLYRWKFAQTLYREILIRVPFGKPPYREL